MRRNTVLILIVFSFCSGLILGFTFRSVISFAEPMKHDGQYGLFYNGVQRSNIFMWKNKFVVISNEVIGM